MDLHNQEVMICSNGKGMICLRWPMIEIHMTIEETKGLIESMQAAVKCEEELKNGQR